MTDLLTEAFKKAQNLPEDIQNELAKQLIEDIESEYQWQETLEQPQSSFLNDFDSLVDAVSQAFRDLS